MFTLANNWLYREVDIAVPMQQEQTKLRRKTEITKTKQINKKPKGRKQRSRMDNRGIRARGKVAKNWNVLSAVMSIMQHRAHIAGN
jgi:hypothetical protein